MTRVRLATACVAPGTLFTALSVSARLPIHHHTPVYIFICASESRDVYVLLRGLDDVTGGEPARCQADVWEERVRLLSGLHTTGRPVR